MWALPHCSVSLYSFLVSLINDAACRCWMWANFYCEMALLPHCSVSFCIPCAECMQCLKGPWKAFFFFLTEQNTGLSAMPFKEYVTEEIFKNYLTWVGIWVQCVISPWTHQSSAGAALIAMPFLSLLFLFVVALQGWLLTKMPQGDKGMSTNLVRCISNCHFPVS